MKVFKISFGRSSVQPVSKPNMGMKYINERNIVFRVIIQLSFKIFHKLKQSKFYFYKNFIYMIIPNQIQLVNNQLKLNAVSLTYCMVLCYQFKIRHFIRIKLVKTASSIFCLFATCCTQLIFMFHYFTFACRLSLNMTGTKYGKQLIVCR